MYIENINSPKDIKELSVEQLSVLAEEVRIALIRKLSEHGGHIGPNLGMVETTIALHYVFNSPIDKIVFDVSHQSYVHKMLTGRMAAFLDVYKRQFIKRILLFQEVFETAKCNLHHAQSFFV